MAEHRSRSLNVSKGPSSSLNSAHRLTFPKPLDSTEQLGEACWRDGQTAAPTSA